MNIRESNEAESKLHVALLMIEGRSVALGVLTAARVDHDNRLAGNKPSVACLRTETERICRLDQDIQILQVLQQINSTYDTDILLLKQNMKDTLHMSYALEFTPFDFLSLRCGYEARETSVNDDYYSLLIPIPDLDIAPKHSWL